MIHIFYTKGMTREPAVSDYTYIARLAVNALDDAWREMNVVEGNEHPVDLKVRSMCVADIMLDLINMRAYRVAGVGFVELPIDDVVTLSNMIDDGSRALYPRHTSWEKMSTPE